MLQRVKEVQESDLRMVGALARNIQRVLAVTQADIDAAAAQGKGWLVKRVVKVNDPLDNLRGGTQLVIKQNSIQPGQNVMRVLYSGNSKTVGPAVAPLSLPGAAADDILSLVAFGGTQQEGVPQEYTRLDRLQGDGTAYIDLGITLNQDDEIEVDFIFKYAAGSQIFGYRDSASSKNITLFSGGGAGSLFMDFNNSDYTNYRLGTTGTDDAQYTAKISKAKRALYSGTTEIVANNTACPDTFTTGNALLFFAGGSPSGTAKFTGSILGVRIKDRMNLVPAKRNSDDVLGMYDTITGQFFTNAAGSGAFIAGDPMTPTPAYPVDIVCNNGVLKARHQSGLPLGYTLLDYAIFNGTQVVDTGLQISTNDEIRAKVYATATGFAYGADTSNPRITLYMSPGGNQRWGTGLSSNQGIPALNTELVVIQNKTSISYNGSSYSMSTTTDFTTINTLTIGNCNGNTSTPKFSGNFYYMEIYQGGSLVAKMVPVKASDDTIGFYDLVRNQFFAPITGTLVAGTAVSDPVEVYADGTVETIAIKDDQSATVSTATCKDLLSVGTYTDEQEIISGVVTRKVGIKVLDGTENWQNLSGYFNLSKTDLGSNSTVMPSNSHNIICSHFETKDGTFTDGVGIGGSYVNFKYDSITTVLADWKTWLAAQYNAGTPVIIIYPLATQTTNTVTPQPMQTAAGDNTAEITQAGMAGLELEVEYVEA